MQIDHRRTGWVALVLQMLVAGDVAAHAHPLGNTLLDWRPDPGIARVSAMNFDFHGGDYFVTWRAPGRVTEIEGRQCLVGGYFFFDVDDAFAFDIDETVRLELTFDRTRTDGFNLSYDHAVNPLFKRVRLPPGGERFHTVTVELERARFANRKYERMDFAIGALGAVHPQPPDVNGELALCDLRISRPHAAPKARLPPGTLALSVRDESGRPTAARVGLYLPDGSSPLPGAAAVPLVPFEAETKQWPLLNRVRGWPSEGRYVFYVDGAYQTAVPAGEYTLVVFKGPEYRIATRRLRIAEREQSAVDVTLERWTDMPGRGWYSADGHIHLARPTPAENARTAAFTSAEDIHVSNLLQVSNVGLQASYSQYAFGTAGHFRRGHHALVSGQESPRSSHRGHTIGLNVPRYFWADDGYFVYDQIASQIAASGGLFGYAHVAIDAFNVRYGLALDVPLGNVSFLEVLQMGMLDTNHYYNFLNMGYRLLPSAGSDYPYIRTAGSERIYARVGASFSVPNWFDAYRTKRSFVTSGPIIEFTVNGDADAVEFDVQRGQEVAIRVIASVNPDFDSLARIDIVQHGEVLATATGRDGNTSLSLDHVFRPERSAWIAIRAHGVDGTVAHTAPIYLIVDGNRRTWQRTLVEPLAEKYTRTLLELRSSSPNLDEDWERATTENALYDAWRRDKPALDQSIDRSIAAYRQLVEAAR